MRTSWAVKGRILLVAFAGSLGVAEAQTLATGDTRTVTEPTIPPICSTLPSQLAIVSGAPASETTFDTSRIQAALTACPSGQAVELAPSGTNYAFLIQPITIPSGVGLIVDGGVTVFASRNPTDYQTSSTELCGTYGSSGNGCNPLIGFTRNGSGSGIYGYGVIDGRGGSTMLVGPNAGETWWANADNANTNGGSQDNPILMKMTANNLTLYKITLRNSPMFHVSWTGTGLTAWGVKISAPYTAHNSDGIDPTGTNVTITNSSISDGDDNVAVGASSASANITVSNLNTYSGHGLSVGSYTSGGLTNYLVNNVNMAGTPQDSNATGLRLKSAADRGGTLNTLTYENVCIRDTRYPLQLNPFYNTNTGTEIPWFQNIVLQNVHVLAPTTNQYPYQVELQGHDVNHITTLTLDNVVFDQLLSTNLTPAPQDIGITLEGNVYPAFLQTLTGSGVTYSGSATAVAGGGVSACSGVFPYIVGELYLSNGTATSLKTASIPATGSVTLNAMLEPAMSQTTFNGTAGSWTGVAAPSKAVNFYEGTTLLGSGTLGANGTVASLTLSNLTAGTHTYTAQYPGDTNYAALAFGSVTVVVTGPTVSSTTTLSAPATAVYGASTVLSATVAGSGGTPTGSVTFYDGTTSVGAQALSAGIATLPAVAFAGGTHTLTASYSGDSTFLPSTSTVSTLVVSPAVTATALTVATSPVAVNGSSLLTATITATSGTRTPTGSVTFTDGSTTLGMTALTGTNVATLLATFANAGSQALKACYSGDSNYASSCGSGSLTVTPIATSLTLSLGSTSVYTGGQVVLTATLSPAVLGETVTFLNGTSSLGTGTTNASGVATYTLTAGAVGADSLTASVAATGNYAAATSAPQALAILNPLALTATPNPVSVTHGSSGTVSLSVSPQGGFSGTAALTCTAAVSYVTCTPGTATVTAGAQQTLTIAVASTTAALRQSKSSTLALAFLAPWGLLALALSPRRRRKLPYLVLLLCATAMAGISGCGGSSSAGTSGMAPSGSQIVTVTAQAASVTQTLSITVNIQ